MPNKGSNYKFSIFILIITIIIALLYFIPQIVNNVEPRLAGLSFFYWYQILLLFVAAIGYFIVSYVSERKR
ncbi:MAG: DUF3311 domain-containing protein [Sulfolobaceae archaeon]